MKILVTGGTVFASRFTAEYFSKENEVYVLNRGTRRQSKGIVSIIADRHALGDALKKYYFDAVIDVTAYNSADIDDLLDGLGEFGNYIMISSSAVYPETLPQPFSEEMETGANLIWGDYGTNKIAAEKHLRERVPNAYILRPPYLYGKYNNLYREAFVFECAEQNRKFYPQPVLFQQRRILPDRRKVKRPRIDKPSLMKALLERRVHSLRTPVSPKLTYQLPAQNEILRNILQKGFLIRGVDPVEHGIRKD